MKQQIDNPTAVQTRLLATAQPLPFHSRLLLREVQTLRYLHCPHYDSCLTIAALQHWESFICLYCPHYKKETKHG